MSALKKIRCTADCGLSVQWGLGQGRDGKWKAMSLGNCKLRGRPIPTDFVPFELSNAVINGPLFDTFDEAERFVRSL